MMRLRKLQIAVSMLILSAYAQFVSADSQTLAQLRVKMNQYITDASAVAAGHKSAVGAAMPAFSQGQDPLWYGGNQLAAGAMLEDLLVNLLYDFPNGFIDCFDFTIHGSQVCKNKWGIPRGWKVSYRLPVQQVLTRRFFQNRYLPPAYYQAIENTGIYESVWYQSMKSFSAPLALTTASTQLAFKMDTKSWLAYVMFHGPIVPMVAGSANFPLDQPDKRGRYDGGMIGETDLNQLEYYLGPNLIHIVWNVIVNYFTFLKKIPCLPPHQSAAPLGSEDPMHIEMTRNPWMGFILYDDQGLQDDLTEWMLNPAVCQEWMMNKQRKNIPFDMVKPTATLLNNPLSFGISLIPNSDILVPLANSDLSKFDRMCTKNWGGSIPFTTVHQVHDTPFISAGKNLLKATRLGYGIWKTFLQGNQAGNYVRYYPFNQKNDAYQLTYKDQWACKSVGNPGKPFAGADAMNTPAEHGLYSMSHWWRLPKCCMSFGAALSLQAAVAAF